MKLRVSDDLVLAADFVTSTQAILAQKGKGKTHTATVEAEELLEAGQQIIVIDPTDAWFGLRSSPDGRSTGYPIAVFGGDHGDVPLEPGGGSVLAEAVVRERFSAIICTETMTKGEELRFVGDFLETLYRKNREAMHLFIDEVDVFAPQNTFGVADARTCGATDDIVRRGRKKGIGCTLITQRASAINKNVLSQADMLVALGCSHPLDLDAIDKWVRKNADPKVAQEMMKSLPSLPRGEAWVWNPSQNLFKRIEVRQRHTFDSGATPRAGEKRRDPKVLAPVDLARLGEAMTAAVQRQKENDPKALRAEVARWKKAHDDLAAQKSGRGLDGGEAKAPAAKIVEKPVLKDAQIEKISKLIEGRVAAAVARANSIMDRAGELTKQAAELISGSTAKLEAELSALRAAIQQTTAPPARADTVRLDRSGRGLDGREDTTLWTPGRRATQQAAAKTLLKPVAKRVRSAIDEWHNPPPATVDQNLKPAHLRILTAIAWWESVGVHAPDLGGVAFVAGTSTKSSSFDNNRSRLRAAGYVDYPSSGHVTLTDAGRALTPPPSLPPTDEALQGAILEMLTPAHGRLLRALVEEYPGELSLEDLAQRAGTSVTSSAFDNNRSWLRARGLAEYPRTGFARATKLLFPENS